MSSTVGLSALIEDHNRWWSRPEHRGSRALLHRRDQFAGILPYLGDSNAGRAVLLVGPRQVGKTTILLQVADHLLDNGWPPGNLTFFDFSDDRLVEPLSPRVIVDTRVAGLRNDWPRVFLFDEIQEATAWQRWLKRTVDESRRAPENERLLLVATGSSAVSLRDGVVESGQGRWDEIPIEGLTYGEFLRFNAGRTESGEPESVDEVLGRDPSAFARYLLTGGFPEHAQRDAINDPLRRIRADVIERAILRDLRRSGVEMDRVRRLFVYLVNGSGSIWNAQARAQDLDANRKSVEEWLSLLEGTHLLHRLDPDIRRTAKANTQLRSRQRVYAADHGLITALSPLSDPLGDPDTRGRVLEAAVFRQLRQTQRERGGQLGYFRREDDLEIDFVWRPPRGKGVGIEVTASRSAKERKKSRFLQAADLAGIGRKLMVYDGVLSNVEGGVEMVPAYQFLSAPGRYLEGTP